MLLPQIELDEVVKPKVVKKGKGKAVRFAGGDDSDSDDGVVPKNLGAKILREVRAPRNR